MKKTVESEMKITKEIDQYKKLVKEIKDTEAITTTLNRLVQVTQSPLSKLVSKSKRYC
jgi:hypothetical protein